MSSNLEELIPDLPLKEYRPAGRTAHSLLAKLNLLFYWGRRGEARRVWVNDGAVAGRGELVISTAIESWHCQKDAEMVFNTSRPGIEILSEFSYLEVEQAEQAVSGERVRRWANHGLGFELRSFCSGKYTCSTLSVRGRDAASSGMAEQQIAAIRSEIRGGDRGAPKRCVQFLWRFLYLVGQGGVVGLLGVIAGATLRSALGLGGVSLASVIAGLLALFAFVVWTTHQTRKFVMKMWSRHFSQGDNDGTVRRALGSIGIELPTASTRST